ncbi:TadE/TadG family type IV pilus assembly protein [Streptomyces sp. NPDC094034]|uniref:TadE/TadG family type IV pilus assembly protein n=1 Tax=Streptomyces sp. NPDC094034 TaxID=3155309 RepID=UPI003318A050
MVKRTAREGRDRGQVALEYVGVISLLIVVAIIAIQLGMAAYAVQQANTAARAAARAETYNEATMDYQEAGRASMSDWLAEGTEFRKERNGDEVTITAEVTIPAILPDILDLGEAKRSVTMPLD